MPAFLKRRITKVEAVQRSTTRRREWALTLECGHVVYRRTGAAPQGHAANCVACCQPISERAMAPGTTVETLSPAYTRLVAYSQVLAAELLGLPIFVRVIHGPNLTCAATWLRDKRRPTLTLNAAHLGPESKFFVGRPSPAINELLIHEFAHQFGDHLEEKFDDAMARLGAALADLALQHPAFFEAYR